MKMQCRDTGTRLKYTFPIGYRKYEKWIRRLQWDYFCVGVEFYTRCNCIWKSKPVPFAQFWTCPYVVHKTEVLFGVLLEGKEIFCL